MSSSSRIEKLPSSYSSASAECQIMCARQQSSDCTKRLNIFSKFAIEKLWQTFSGQKKISHTKRKTESSGLSNGKNNEKQHNNSRQDVESSPKLSLYSSIWVMIPLVP